MTMPRMSFLHATPSLAVGASPKQNPVASARDNADLSLDYLDWTPEEAWATRARLASFAEDWDAPGMEAYDRD